MNPFEKIFNYGILSRLENSGTFMITSHERSWLKAMLQHSAAKEAFTSETLQKLNMLLETDDVMEVGAHLLQKAASLEQQVYHPHIRSLRRAIISKSGIRISYGNKGGRLYTNEVALPYKLEYSMVKREWYLLWYHVKKRMLMSTKLSKIQEISAEPYPSAHYDELYTKVSALLAGRKTSADIEVVPAYNMELSRILYAFSCFEKEVSYNKEKQTYTVRLHFASNDAEYVLSKVRFLGKRVRLLSSEQMRRRMQESATWALQRYGVDL